MNNMDKISSFARLLDPAQAMKFVDLLEAQYQKEANELRVSLFELEHNESWSSLRADLKEVAFKAIIKQLAIKGLSV